MLAFSLLLLAGTLLLFHYLLLEEEASTRLVAYLVVVMLYSLTLGKPLMFFYYRDIGYKLVRKEWQKVVYGLKFVVLLAFAMVAQSSHETKNILIAIAFVTFFILRTLSIWPLEKVKMKEEDEGDYMEDILLPFHNDKRKD